jgi:hypothetical protein
VGTSPRAFQREMFTIGSMPVITIPDHSLCVFAGGTAAVRRAAAHAHFAQDEIAGPGLNSEEARSFIAARLAGGLSAVLGVQQMSTEEGLGLTALARSYHAAAAAFIPGVPEQLLPGYGGTTPAAKQLRRIQDEANATFKACRRQGFSPVKILGADDFVPGAIVRCTLREKRLEESGPFDIIGDIHGCLDELIELATAHLGYSVHQNPGVSGRRSYAISHPSGRRLLSVGDMCDRGPDSPGVLAFFIDALEAGSALCIRGNHDDKLLRSLTGRPVKIAQGLELTLRQLAACPPGFSDEVARFLGGLTSHMLLDGGNLAVAHAGLKESMLGRSSPYATSFSLYGDTGEGPAADGLPERGDWAKSYNGDTVIAYGHTVREQAVWEGNTICLDTGCVFGGGLTAMRWPERELVTVPAHRQYWLRRNTAVSDPISPQAGASPTP